MFRERDLAARTGGPVKAKTMAAMPSGLWLSYKVVDTSFSYI